MCDVCLAISAEVGRGSMVDCRGSEKMWSSAGQTTTAGRQSVNVSFDGRTSLIGACHARCRLAWRWVCRAEMIRWGWRAVVWRKVSEMQKCKGMNDKEVSRNGGTRDKVQELGMEVLGIRFRSSEWRYSGLLRNASPVG